MASDLFPVRRGRQAFAKNSNDGEGMPQGNPLSDALLRAFRQTFGTSPNDAAMQRRTMVDQTADGTIVPFSGETNP